MDCGNYTVYGYGICVSDISVSGVDKIFNLVHMAPEFEKEFINWTHELLDESDEDITESEVITLDDIDEYCDSHWHYGVPAILMNVIRECEGVQLSIANNYAELPHLLCRPRYPWHSQGNEANLTEEKLNSIFAKYVSILTDKPVNIDYRSFECAD